jgi:hypothetical protein
VRRRRVLRWILRRLRERIAEANIHSRRGNQREAIEASARAEELADMAVAFADEVQP